MLKFIVKRLFYAIITIFIISSLSFFLIALQPGDPIIHKAKKMPPATREMLYRKYGLDRPPIERYFKYLKGFFVDGNLGDSVEYPGRTVNDIMEKSVWVSAKVGGIAVIIQVVLGIILGMIAALAREKMGDHIIRVLVVLGVCIPQFVFCALLQYYVGFKWSLTPILGWGELKHYILPVIAYALPGIAVYCKYMRNSAISVMNEDYILTAKAKGVRGFRLVRKHILRNAILPIITILPVALGAIFSGAMVIERFFSIPGLGQHYVESVSHNDEYMILGMSLFFAITYIISLVFVDVLYGIVDPRIRIVKGRA